jgi:hypothetical protein
MNHEKHPLTETILFLALGVAFAGWFIFIAILIASSDIADAIRSLHP